MKLTVVGTIEQISQNQCYVKTFVG